MAAGIEDSGRLADNVAYFARALRAAGLPVGPGDVVDAVAALESAGIGSREDFYWILHAVLVRRHEHALIYDQAFRLFWRRRDLIEKLIAQMSPIAPAAPEAPKRPEAGALRVHDALGGRKPPPPPREERLVSAELTTSDREVLKTKDFAQMTAAEVTHAKALIDRLEFPDDRAPTRRHGPARRGAVDPRRTFRRLLRAGGAGIDLAFREPRPRPPPLVALVDISGSMAEYSRLFLHFLHALGDERRRVHSFVFATRLTNVSRELRRRDPDEALALASARVEDWEGGTRISAALHAFNRHWSRRVLAGGAVVLLFTDGLEREASAELAFEMDRLKRSCRRLVWLNPLLRFGGFEARAAGIRAMLPHVHDFRPIHDLASMEALCRALTGRDAGPSGDPRRYLAPRVDSPGPA